MVGWDGCMVGWLDEMEWLDGMVGGWMDGWMAGWRVGRDGWLVVGWMVGWDGCMVG